MSSSRGILLYGVGIKSLKWTHFTLAHTHRLKKIAKIVQKNEESRARTKARVSEYGDLGTRERAGGQEQNEAKYFLAFRSQVSRLCKPLASQTHSAGKETFLCAEHALLASERHRGICVP